MILIVIDQSIINNNLNDMKKVAIASAILAASALGSRKTFYKDPAMEKDPRRPKLRAYDDSWCPLDNGANSICLDHNVDMEWGIEWLQTYNDVATPEWSQDWWKLRPQIYSR